MRSFHKFEAHRKSWFYWYVATRELAVRSQRATRELGVEAPACARAPRPCPSCPLPCCPCPRPSCPRPGGSLAVRPRSPPDSPGQVLLLLLALAEPRLPAEGAFSPRVARRLGAASCSGRRARRFKAFGRSETGSVMSLARGPRPRWPSASSAASRHAVTPSTWPPSARRARSCRRPQDGERYPRFAESSARRAGSPST